jgi:hypothetical protein
MAVTGGRKPGAGRPKGSKDKISRNLKQLVLDTVEKLESEDKSLYDCALADPPWFYANFVKPMLPKDVVVSGDEENPLITEIIIKHVTPGTGTSR